MGGTPGVLGGGGLELQIDDTQRELSELGQRVVRIESAPANTDLDLVHAFGSEPDNWQRVRNWYRNRVPLVVTPVISISTRSDRLALRAAARMPGIVSSARMRRELLEAATAIVALTSYERGLVTNELGIDKAIVHVMGNGVHLPARPLSHEVSSKLPPGNGSVLMVGRVTAWKRQADVLRAVAGRHPIVVAGPLESEPSRDKWEALVARANAVWLGSVGREELAGLYERARALVHLSVGEVQSLAILEALSTGTPVIASDIPPHRELEREYGSGWVRIIDGPSGVTAALDDLDRHPPPRAQPEVPSARDVASKLVALYQGVLS
jgi:glycosyltransferase involved in cell wall biosynthesis